MSRIRAFLPMLLPLLALISTDAAAATDPENILDNAYLKYVAAASGWATVITNAASWLYWTLVLISMVWTFSQMALRRASSEEFLGEFLKFTMFTGIFFWLLINAPQIAKAIYNSLTQLAATAAGLTGAQSPSGVVDIGVNILDQVLARSSVFSPVDSAIGILCALLILFVLALVGINMLLMMIAAYVMAYAGIFLLGFGGSRWTSDMAIHYFKTVLQIAIQLFAMVLLVGIGKTFLDDYYTSMDAGINLKDLAVMMIVSLILLVLVNKVPPMISGIVSGAGLAAAGGLGNAGVGDAMRGGAMVAAGGAAIAAAGAAGMSAMGQAAQSIGGGAQALMAAVKKGQDNVASGSDILASMAGKSGGGSGDGGGKSGGASEFSKASGAASASSTMMGESRSSTDGKTGDSKSVSAASKSGDAASGMGGKSTSPHASGGTASSKGESKADAPAGSGDAGSASSGASNVDDDGRAGSSSGSDSDSSSGSSDKSSVAAASDSASGAAPDAAMSLADATSALTGGDDTSGDRSASSANRQDSTSDGTSKGSSSGLVNAGRVAADAAANLMRGAKQVAGEAVSDRVASFKEKASQTVGGRIASAINNPGQPTSVAGKARAAAQAASDAPASSTASRLATAGQARDRSAEITPRFDGNTIAGSFQQPSMSAEQQAEIARFRDRDDKAASA